MGRRAMITQRITDFDLGQICRSGQCFRMNEAEDGRFSVIAFGRHLTLWQTGEAVCFDCEQDEFEQVWRSYFDIDADYGAYKRAIDPGDTYLQEAAAVGGGIRILRQELFETVICFIISQQNNIFRIKKCVENLALLFGETCYNKSKEVYNCFPTAQALAQCTEQELAPCRLGYRARYIVKAARQIASGEVDLDEIARLPYAQAREQLQRLTGVGIKIAECICLFALHQIDAFPVDTHIRQMLDRHYPDGFPLERYAGFAGILQQYGFYYELGV